MTAYAELPPEGPFDRTIRIPAPLVYQGDPRWGTEHILCDYEIQGNDIFGYDCATPIDHRSAGCVFSSIAMALQFHHLYGQYFTFNPSNPIQINYFFWWENALKQNTVDWYSLDVTALSYYNHILLNGTDWYSGLSFETYGWPEGQAELDRWIDGHTGDPFNIYDPYFTDKIPVLRLNIPIDSNGDGKWDNQDDVDHDGYPDKIGHTVVVTGWDDSTNSYIIHDPSVDKDIYAWDWFYRTGVNPATNPITGNYHLSSFLTLHQYYANQKFDEKVISPGGLNLIYEVWWFTRVELFNKNRGLSVYIDSPLEAVAIDPDGKRAGFDPITGSRIREVKANYYTQPNFSLNGSSIDTKVLEIPQPKEGKYRIMLTGTGDGPYTISFNNSDQSFSGVVEKNEIKKIEIDYSLTGLSAQETSNFLPEAYAATDTPITKIGNSINLSASSSTDFDGVIESYIWDFGDGEIGYGEKIEHSYQQEGDFTVTLSVEDNQGGVGTATLNIHVENPPPPAEPQPPIVKFARMGWDGNLIPSGPYVGLASTGLDDEAFFQFYAYGINPDGGNTSAWTWKWDFGDGTTPVNTYQYQNNPIGNSGVTHVYALPGTYTLTVIFNNGIQESPPATTTVEVYPALKHNEFSYKLNSSCYVASSKIRTTGRLKYIAYDYSGFELPSFWYAGLDLGRLTLKEWLDRDFYFVITTPQKDKFWVLGEIDIQAPDLSFVNEFTLPDLGTGDYLAYIYPGRWSGESFDPSSFPLYLDSFPGEVGLIGVNLEFTNPCPAPSNLTPIVNANGPYQGVVGQPVSLDSTGTYDPDGNDDSLQYRWFIPITSLQGAPINEAKPEILFDEPGTYTVSLIVEDELGGITYPSINRPNSYATVTILTEQANTPPIANAGENISILSEYQDTFVIHGAATDPDGDAMTYRWLKEQTELIPWQDVINGEANLYLNDLTNFENGQHTLTLEVNDGATITSDNMILTIDNSAPHSAPSGAGVYEINSAVVLGGFVSDFDGDTLEYKWIENSYVIHSSSIESILGGSPVELPAYTVSNLGIGTHTISLEVNDGINQSVIREIIVDIVDTGEPTLAPVSNQLILWPPNHKMADILIESNASDDSGLPVALSVTVSSDEPINGLGDGDMTPDWTQPVINQETGVIMLQLRAERSGSGNGREYTIAITATDQSGNSSTVNMKVVVPHDMKKQ